MCYANLFCEIINNNYTLFLISILKLYECQPNPCCMLSPPHKSIIQYECRKHKLNKRGFHELFEYNSMVVCFKHK
jgi:hypothetical protein